MMFDNINKRVVTVRKADGTVVPIGQVRRRFLGIPYWDSLIVFDSWYEAAKWVENAPDNLNI